MKKPFILLTCLLTITICKLFGQITFQKKYAISGDDLGYCVQQTNDGGYIITGTTAFGVGDICLIKTDSAGNKLWSKTYGGTEGDAGYSVKQIFSGGYVVVGYTTYLGVDYLFLFKTDQNGDTLWTKTFDEVGGSGEQSYDIQQTNDSGYVIVASKFTTMDFDVWLVKTDIDGNVQWSKTYGCPGNDVGYSVQQTNDSGYIIVGTNSLGNRDAYLIKTDANGTLLWSKTYGGSNWDEGHSVVQTFDGGYIFTGWTESFGAGSLDVYLVKTDSIGDTLWTKAFGGTSYDDGYSVQQTLDSGYIIAGVTNRFPSNNSVYLIKTHSNGDTLWVNSYDASNADDAFFVQQTLDGGFIVTGYIIAGSNVYLLKTDSYGNSGCNRVYLSTIVSSTATQIGIPATIESTHIIVFNPTITNVNSVGTTTTLCSNVGINEMNLNYSPVIFPNPTTNNFAISFDNIIGNGIIQLFNLPGEKVFEETIFNESHKEIILKNISAGIYIVKVFDGEKSYCKKLIVE